MSEAIKHLECEVMFGIVRTSGKDNKKGDIIVLPENDPILKTTNRRTGEKMVLPIKEASEARLAKAKTEEAKLKTYKERLQNEIKSIEDEKNKQIAKLNNELSAKDYAMASLQEQLEKLQAEVKSTARLDPKKDNKNKSDKKDGKNGNFSD